MDAVFGKSHIHTSARELTISTIVVVILGIIVFKVVLRQLNIALTK